MAFLSKESTRAAFDRLARRRITIARAEMGWGLLLALVAILIISLLWRSLVAAPELRVDVGAWGDHTYLSGTNAIETSATENYRWTTAQAELAIPNLSNQYQLVLRASGGRPQGQPPPSIRVDIASQAWGHVQIAPSWRIYHILLPRNRASPTIRVDFESQVYTAPNDPRQLGFVLDWIELRPFGQPSGPNPWHLCSQALLLALLMVLLVALALPRGWAFALAGLFGGALVWANFVQPLWVSQAIGPWLIVVTLLLAATWWLAPRLRRAAAPWMAPGQANLAWALFVAALGLRLLGAVHPLFSAHDVDVHTSWLDIVNRGELYLYSTPGEFRSQKTFNPPAGYILLMPLSLLLPSPRLVMQVGVALFDAIGCLALVALARELRLSATAALLALAFYLALPINMTMLWWGFATNTIAQPLGLLLLCSLLQLIHRPTRAAAVAFAILSAVCMLTHVGALVLILATLALALLLGWRRLPPTGRNIALGALAVALLFAALIYFMAVAGPVFGQFRDTNAPTLNISATLAKNWDQRSVKLNLVMLGFLRGFLPLPLALASLGVVGLLTAHARRPAPRVLIVAWLGVCVLFLAADLSLSLLVRYIYFVAPLICLALGALLARLWRHRNGRIVVLGLEFFVAWVGVAIWLEGVLLHVKPSVVSLSH